MARIITILILLLMIRPLSGQIQSIDSIINNTPIEYSLEGQLYCKSNSNLIRWAPDKSFTWVLGNRRGYNVLRIVNDSTYILLNDTPILPATYDQFKSEYEKDTSNLYLGYAAGALYNEQIKSYEDMGFVEKSQLLNNRFSFSLLSADFDFRTAEMLGLAFVDNYDGDIPIGYIIEMAGDSTEAISVTDAILEKEYDDVSNMKPPRLVNYWAENNIGNIRWDHLDPQHRYTAFWVEKSVDSISFTRVNKQPFVVSSQNVSDQLDYALFRDTLSIEKQYYRLRGLNSFGQVSEPSHVFSLKANDLNPPIPPTIDTLILSENGLEIKWSDSDNDIQDKYRSHIIKYGEKTDSLFAVNEVPILRGQTSFIDTTALFTPTTSYRIMSYDSLGNFSSSDVKSLDLVDSFPPRPPVSLRAITDSLGIVKIGWDANKESDLKGYYLYYANDTSDVYARRTNFTLDYNYYIDTISLKSLSPYLYYRVAAVDKKMNVSDLSDWLQVARPDTIPPVAPLFKKYRVTSDSIYFLVIPSASPDVVSFVLEQQLDDKWIAYNKLDVDQIQIEFANELPERTKFRLRAVDKSENSTTSPDYIAIDASKKKIDLGLSNFEVIYEESQNSLTWNVSENIQRVKILRASNSGRYTTLKIVNATNSFVDSNLASDKEYTYAIQALGVSGNKSTLLKQVK